MINNTITIMVDARSSLVNQETVNLLREDESDDVDVLKAIASAMKSIGDEF